MNLNKKKVNSKKKVNFDEFNEAKNKFRRI